MTSLWQVDAGFIKEMDDVKYEDLVTTRDIEDFFDIERDTKYFIIASKGFGKTLLLKYKRYLYQDKYKSEDYTLIPYGELVDKLSNVQIFSKNKIDLIKEDLLSEDTNWNKIWSVSLILSIIKNLIKSNKNTENEVVIELLNDFKKSKTPHSHGLIDDECITPFDFLVNILYMNHSDFYDLTVKELNKLTAIIRGKSIPTAIFIDNVDELFEKHIDHINNRSGSSGVFSPDIWYNSQIGLIFASRGLSTVNGHIKVFASIRKEALLYLNNHSSLGQQISGNVLDLKYSENEIKQIFIKNIKKMKEKDLADPKMININGKEILSFLGIETVLNRHTNENEDIFKYIYRHTLKRPRDIINMGHELYLNTEKNDISIMKNVNSVATAIANNYLNEIIPHIDFNKERFNELFKLLDSHILSENRIKTICKKFNGKKTCEDADCKKCRHIHAFCNLYKIGLLGIVKYDDVTDSNLQYFLFPGEETFAEKGLLPHSSYYLIHPILNKLIHDVNPSFRISDRVIVGNDYPWEQLKRKCCFKNNQECKYSESSQGIFLISSNKYKSIIEEIYKKLESLKYEVEPWFKSEGSTGLLFCDKVCKKIRNNSSIIADISDMNPNVFFEVGFSLGLGKSAVTIKEKKIVKIINFNMLYEPYSNLEEIFNLLTNTSHSEKIRPFSNIDQFEFPQRRKKNGLVYVLSFNQDNEIINKLKEQGYIQPNHLDQIFTKPDLIRELIDARAVLVHLEGRQNMINDNQLNDAQLLFLGGICAAQSVPVKIFQSNNNFYSDVSEIRALGQNYLSPLP